MRIAWKIAHLVAFAALAATAVLMVDRVVQPSIRTTLLLALGLGLLVGLPGYLHERALPAGIILLPAGLYLLMRVVLPLTADIETRADQLAFYGDALKLGLQAYADDIFPLTLSAVSGFELLIAVAVFLLVASASFIGLGARMPVFGLAVLVVPLGFTTTVDSSPTTIPTLLFLGFAILTLVTSEGARRHGWRLRDAVGGTGMGAAAVGLALVLLAVFPGLTRPGWADWQTWDLFSNNRSAVLVFNWNQNYPRLLDPGNPVPIMRVTSPLPSYWRAATLDFFTGDSWVSSTPFPLTLPGGPGPREVPRADPEPPGSLAQQTFELTGTSTNYIFTGGYPRSLTIDIPDVVHVSDAGALRSETILPSPVRYEMTAVVPRVPPAQMVGTPRGYPDEVRERYLQLPFPDAATYRQIQEQAGVGSEGPVTDGPERLQGAQFAGIYSLNETIIDGAEDPYEITLRIERYLRTNYSYALQVPSSSFTSPIAAFLFDTRIGYCQHYAGAMALLLRLNGIPSRVAVGFTTGEEIGTWTYLVTSNNAHAWVEAYFTGIGWLPFDATPGRELPVAGASSTSPGFVDPFAARNPSGEPAVPAPLPNADERLPQDVQTGTGGQTVLTRIPWGLAVPVLLIAALLAWPFARRTVRERHVRSGRAEERLRASIRLLRADLVVAGVPVRDSWTLDQVADRVSKSLRLDLTQLVRRSQEVAFGGADASAEDVMLAEQTRRDVLRIAWSKRRLPALGAWYGVASLLERGRTGLRTGGTTGPPTQRGPTWRLRP